LKVDKKNIYKFKLLNVFLILTKNLSYRVGAFGFLNAQTEEAPGNMGIYDQSLGLNWIKDNVEQFGGDPEKLVPFGQSAGAISIGTLMTFDETKNLFSRAITASGGALMPGILYSKTVENAEKFAKFAGCAQKKEFKTSPKKVVKCLKKAPLNKLLEVSHRFERKK
jgi:carboxylesterase type B